MSKIGKNIHNLRIKNNMSQDELGKKLNVTRQAISNWENNKTQPDMDTIKRIAEIFNTDFQYLVDGIVNDSKNRSRLLLLLILSSASFLAHFVLGIIGLSNLVGMLIGPGTGFTLNIIIYFAFENSIKNNDFTMIAGYDKNKNYNMDVFKKVLINIRLIILLLAFIINIFYSTIYFIDSSLQMSMSLIFLGIYVFNLIGTVLIVNLKYKKDMYL